MVHLWIDQRQVVRGVASKHLVEENWVSLWMDV